MKFQVSRTIHIILNQEENIQSGYGEQMQRLRSKSEIITQTLHRKKENNRATNELWPQQLLN